MSNFILSSLADCSNCKATTGGNPIGYKSGEMENMHSLQFCGEIRQYSFKPTRVFLHTKSN